MPCFLNYQTFLGSLKLILKDKKQVYKDQVYTLQIKEVLVQILEAPRS